MRSWTEPEQGGPSRLPEGFLPLCQEKWEAIKVFEAREVISFDSCFEFPMATVQRMGWS